MKPICKRTLTALALGAAIILSGCSSSSGGGGPVPAKIEDANKRALAVAATEGAKQAVSGKEASGGLLPKGVPLTGLAAARALTENMVTTDLAVDLGFCDNAPTGTADYVATGNGATVSYSNCSLGGAVYNGSATIVISNSGGTIATYSIDYNNFTIAYGGDIETIDLSATCTINTSTLDSSCTYSSSALGIDGRTYNVSNIDVSGDSFSGYSVSATVTDPDFGTINIGTDIALTFNCSDGTPDSGQITVTSGGDTMTVTFNSCAGFTVTFNGVGESYNWADI